MKKAIELPEAAATEILAADCERLEGPYELVSDLIGCVSGGPEDLSEQTGCKFRKALEKLS